MTIAYLDCFSGISGDMLLGSFLDAGLDIALVEKNFKLLALAGFEVSHGKIVTHGLSATKVEISVQEGQPQRSYKDIKQLLLVSHLAEDIKENALAVFTALAEAEATVHGVSLDKVHFHEVGAVDSILDIVGACVGFSFFGIDSLVSSPLPMGHGWVDCEHGRLPLPAPAVVELCKEMQIYGVDQEQELVTPTGAAIIKALADNFGPMPSLTLSHTGYGAGNHVRTDNSPNMLRLFIGQETEIIEAQEVEVIDCHLDDWAPETYPYLCDRLFAAQALDVSLIPIQMKKGRPGFLLRVLAENNHAQQCKRLILDETTAIGLRFRKERRWTLPRRAITLKTRFGNMVAKEVDTPSGTRIYPEYEECRRLAEEQGVPIQQIYHEVLGHNAT
ncbi:MAG: nickel pincer cofactor biosynthesis protein LarC [Proteobacteria bacterium]|nr:nickel pincer cofactor biosynthesis protein LarC [Pseudomonadota bacterium]MBU1640747.1 nickel pincer cofactor biosynthesis protein LarC [Pseudomonadota bacterium]